MTRSEPLSQGASYNRDIDYWRQYNAFHPEAFRLHDDALPNEETWSWRDARVHLDRYAAPEAPAKLIVVHGGGGYGRLFFMTGIAARNGDAEVVAPDLPGYGLTSFAGRYTYGDWVELVSDLIDAELERDGRPVFVLGGSMGGLVAYAAAALNRKVAGVVGTCFLDARRLEVRRAVSRFKWTAPFAGAALSALGAVAGGLRVPMKLVGDMRAMSTHPRLNEIVVGDPYGGGNSVPLGFLASFLDYAPPLEPERFDVCPILVVHPELDAWTPPHLTRDFFDRLEVAKRWVDLERAAHFPVETPGIFQLRDAIREFLRSPS